MFKNKKLLITGGTGSFGNAVLNRFIDSEFDEIRIFSRDEKKQDDMRHKLSNPKVKFYIGDVRDRLSVDNVMEGVDFVFHAAALKQVPSCEFFPVEAVKTNVLGTSNVLDSAIINNVKKVVVLSTDKACYPINAMGISKAMMEKVAISKGRTLGKNANTTICCTRYGNVMASRGSVIPLFVNQIKSNQSITITDPQMTRFMMTLDDAIDLVLYAWKNGENGDLFVQKSPASTIGLLAEVLIDMYGVNSDVSVIGTRHGEKLYETLVTSEEMAKSKNLDKYYQIPCDRRDLNYEKFISKGDNSVNSVNDYNSHNTHRLNKKDLKTLLLKLSFIKDDLSK